MTPAPTRVRTLREGLHLLETEVPDFDVRAALLVGRERAIVWDTLAHPEQMAPVAALAKTLPITVVYSHADWDHVWGTSGLPRGAGRVHAVIACEATAVRFQGDVQADLERRRSAAEPGVLDRVELVAPTITFRASHRIDLGGATLELHELPGHTRDCIIGLVPEWGVLLAGDTVETPLPVVNDGAAVPKWIQQLDRWTTDSRIATVVPSHGRVGGRELIEETTGYLRTLLPEPAGVDHAAGGAWDLSAFPPFYAMTHERNRRRMSERG